MRRILSHCVLSIVLCLLGAMPLQAGVSNRTTQITVAAAADLKFALDEIVLGFQKENPDAKITVTYGSSGNLFAQIDNGAPFDLFLSADIDFPRKLIENKKALAGSLFSYAVGRVVVWVPKDSPIDVEKI